MSAFGRRQHRERQRREDRQAREQLRHSALANARARGCTCDAKATLMAANQVYVQHQPHCPRLDDFEDQAGVGRVGAGWMHGDWTWWAKAKARRQGCDCWPEVVWTDGESVSLVLLHADDCAIQQRVHGHQASADTGLVTVHSLGERDAA